MAPSRARAAVRSVVGVACGVLRLRAKRPCGRKYRVQPMFPAFLS
jgi:hypothetical protein